MEILVWPKRLLKLMGILPKQSVKYPLILFTAIIKWIWFCLIFYIIIPQITYIITMVMAGYINKATTVFYHVITYIGNAIQFLLLIIYKDDIKMLLNDMEQYINTNLIENPLSKLPSLENRFSKLCKIYNNLIAGCMILYVFRPALTQIYAYFSDTIDEQTFFAPFDDVYYFDSSKSPIYELCYLLASLSAVALALAVVTVDLIFCGVCYYIVGMYMELKNVIKIIDDDELMRERKYDRKSTIAKCVNFHTDILSFIKRGNGIFSKIIFIQYAYSLLALAGNIYEASLTKSVGIVPVMLTCIGYNVELFAFCWTGSLVIDQGKSLMENVYNLKWYKYPVKEIKMLQLILLKANKPFGLSAFNYFHCNIESFAQITSHAFSALAFLKSVS